MKQSWLKQVHEAARSNASYEQYMQSTVHNWREDAMPGEDAEHAPRWVRWLPLAVIHGCYWPTVYWLRKRYLAQLVEILWYEVLRVVVCGRRGHDLEDTGSWANGDSGGEDLTCKRCGFHFHHTYY